METVISIVALSFSIISTAFGVITFLWTIRRDRKQATLEAYNRLQNEVFDRLNTYLPAQIREISLDTKSEDYKKISGYLARIEHFCVGINERIYDRNVFYSLAHGYFDGNQLRKRIEPIIETKNKSRRTNELFYNDILSVLQWMDKKTSKNEAGK